jgi:hypothetical protein
MPFSDELRKTMGMPKEPGKDTWPRQVPNNALPPQRREADPNYEPPQMRHGIRELKIENTGRIIDIRQQWEQRQQSQRLPDPTRHLREGRQQHEQFMRDGMLPAPTKADGTPEYKTVNQFSPNLRPPVGDDD